MTYKLLDTNPLEDSKSKIKNELEALYNKRVSNDTLF
jgi:hypothetical protein